MIEIILFTGFIVISILDAWSTNRILKHNHRLLHDKKYFNKFRKVLLKEESKAEMSKPARKMINKYGPERALLYTVIFLSFPASLAFLYLMFVTQNGVYIVLMILCWMFGVLYNQVWSAMHLKKHFGVLTHKKIKEE